MSGNTYCTPSFFNDGSAEHYINGVLLGSISTVNTGYTSDANGWNDRFFDGDGTVTGLTVAGSYGLTITGGPMDDMYYAWIDFDHDGSFTSAELIGSEQTGSPNEEVTINFTVPDNAPIGYTGMRILCIDYYDPAPDPCGGFAYGEAEDYAVLIGSDAPCAPTFSEGTTQGDFISAILIDSAPLGTPGSAGQFPYRPIEGAVHLDAGSTHDLIIASGDYATDRYMAWVDWNNNGAWGDPGELVGEVLSTTSLTAYLMELNVPASAWGWFPMRVRCADSEVLVACNDETYGETRDFMIVVDNPMLPCLTYNFLGSTTGLGIQHFDVNGSNGDVPHGHPNHWLLPLDPVVHVSPGDALDIAVTGMPGNAGNLVVCYVDLNNDLDFDDPSETSDYVQGTAPDQVMSLTLAIPVGTPAGGHWVRIASYGQGFEFVDGCRDPAAGQVVDTYVIVDDPTGPCIPGDISWTIDGHFIDGVQLGDIQNIGSGARFSPVYTDHPQSSTELIVTHDYTLNITSGAQPVSTYRAWIDYNNDLDFDDAGELLGSTDSDTPHQTLSIPFTVPEGLVLGVKYLRVRCDFGAEPAACEDGQWGETEDYRVEVGGNTRINQHTTEPWSVQVVNGGESIDLFAPGLIYGCLAHVLDADGRSLLSTSITGNVTHVPLGDLGNGMYTVRVVGHYVKRFIVSR